MDVNSETRGYRIHLRENLSRERIRSRHSTSTPWEEFVVPSDTLSAFRKRLHTLIMVIAWIAAFALGLMALVIFINVVGRYLFRMPLKGTVEIVELALVITVFFAMAYTEVVQGHITMDEVVARFPRRARSILLSIMCFAAAAFFFMIGYGDTVLAVSFLRPIVRVTDILHIPTAPFIFVIAIGAVIFGLELLLNGLCTWPSADRNEDEVI